MGCTNSTPEPLPGDSAAPTRKDEAQAASKSNDIEKEIDRARQSEDLKVKLLLLGAGESGKSTIFKQMRILYGAARTDDELKMYGVVVRSNIITAMRRLCSHLGTLGLEDQLSREADPESEGGDSMSVRDAYDLLVKYVVDQEGSVEDLELPEQEQEDWVGKSPRAGLGPNNDCQLFLRLWKPIKIMWESQQMKEVWSKRSAVNMIDSHKEYLQDIMRIAAPTFRPTTQDILLARVKTTQVVMERYRIDGIEFEMYDVGGQRSERRKWIDCFDNVDAVIFVAALSEYDQNLAEAKRTNRMSEALELFRSISNNRAFNQTSVMLFLNKKDIFQEKIMYSDISAQPNFSDFPGPPRDFNAGILYFIQKFKDCLLDDEFNDSFIHVTCATDTNNMEFVLDSTRTIIMTDNLRRSGFLGQG